MNNLTKYILLAAVAVGFAASSKADPELILSDGIAADTVTVTGSDGFVSFDGAVGSNWFVNVTTGTDNAPSAYEFNLNSIDLSLGAGTLQIQYTDTGFTTAGSASSGIGGVNATGGSLSFDTLASSSNIAFGGSVLTSEDGLNSSAFSDTASNTDPLSGTYSLTEIVDITHSIGGTTAFGATVSVPDQGATALLIGLGLVAIGLSSRWMNRVRA
jgi:hypothetical protein